MKAFVILIALVFLSIAAMPASAQQSMADVVYGDAAQRDILSSIPPENNRSHVSAVQQELRARGYKVSVDGKWGPQTRKAVQAFQRKKRLSGNGQLNDATLRALGVPVGNY